MDVAVVPPTIIVDPGPSGADFWETPVVKSFDPNSPRQSLVAYSTDGVARTPALKDACIRAGPPACQTTGSRACAGTERGGKTDDTIGGLRSPAITLKELASALKSGTAAQR